MGLLLSPFNGPRTYSLLDTKKLAVLHMECPTKNFKTRLLPCGTFYEDRNKNNSTGKNQASRKTILTMEGLLLGTKAGTQSELRPPSSLV